MRARSGKFLFALLSAAALQGAVAIRAPAIAGVPGSTSPINLDAHGIALGGYDPVAYFDGGKPTKGDVKIFASYAGARYLFATAAHRKIFLQDPEKYVPEFGGYCVVGAAHGEKVDVDPQTGEVVSGKLYVNNSQKALDIFHKDQPGTIAKAQANWPSVKNKAL
jgi:YHS domain-containing protein